MGGRQYCMSVKLMTISLLLCVYQKYGNLGYQNFKERDTKLDRFWLLFCFVNRCQKLGISLGNKGKLKLAKNENIKKICY